MGEKSSRVKKGMVVVQMQCRQGKMSNTQRQQEVCEKEL